MCSFGCVGYVPKPGTPVAAVTVIDGWRTVTGTAPPGVGLAMTGARLYFVGSPAVQVPAQTPYPDGNGKTSSAKLETPWVGIAGAGNISVPAGIPELEIMTPLAGLATAAAAPAFVSTLTSMRPHSAYWGGSAVALVARPVDVTDPTVPAACTSPPG